MTTTAPEIETHRFQAEARQLLDLMIHSLYTHKEIFLRELISNASDALDRLRFEALTDGGAAAAGEPEIRLEPGTDPASGARTLTVHDNGVGMSRQEVIDNIGTIAKSGTRELVERLKQGGSDAAVAELIGQFGVGFYSASMVSDRVVLVTRPAGDEGATRWESAGDGTYTVADAERPAHGTSITLHLKPEDAEEGLDDFTDEWVLKRIVKRYSDFVIYPIRLKVQREQPARDEEGKPKEGESETVVEDLTLNSMKPIWARPESEVGDREHEEFYRHISHDWNPPLTHVSLRAEGRFEYQALLYVPKEAPYDLYYVGFEPGLQLYVRRVMIQEHCTDLLPRYLRFVKGVVEAPDLPLNVSRETLQSNRQIGAIKKGLVRKLLDSFEAMRTGEPETYLELWGQFGRAIKEGVSEERDQRDRLLGLLLFASSADSEKLTTLAEYAGRMKDGQKEIFYLTGESREQLDTSPHLEAFRDRGVEVLLLTDPVDELLVQSLSEFEGKRLKSIGKGTVDLPGEDSEATEEKKKELETRDQELRPLLDAIQKTLDEHVKQVRLSNRLTASPACLVGAEHDYSPQLEKILLKGKGGGLKQRRILELNPEHEILTRLIAHHAADAADPVIADYAELLFGYAALAEGSELSDPVRFNQVLAGLMTRGL
jgi:molecular chaperone HtpG